MPISIGDALGQGFFNQFYTQMNELVNGVLQLIDKDGGGTIGGRIGLLLGPPTTSGVFIVKSSSTGQLSIRTGVDALTGGVSTIANIQVGSLTVLNAAGAAGTGVQLGTTLSATVGAAGAAAAPPASPEVYLNVFANTNARKVACYLP